MKRLGLWTTAVIAILLVAPIAHASAAERPGYWQTATATPTPSITATAVPEPAAQSGWTDQDTVETTGIGILALLGAAALANQTRSVRSARRTEEFERQAAEDQRHQQEDQQHQQRDELMLNALGDVLAAVDTYLFTRKRGETAEKSVVHDVFSGLYRFQSLAGSPPSKGAEDFRRVVAAALTTDLDARPEHETIHKLIKVQINDDSETIPHDAASLSNVIHRMADKLQEDIEASRQPVERSA